MHLICYNTKVSKYNLYIIKKLFGPNQHHQPFAQSRNCDWCHLNLVMSSLSESYELILFFNIQYILQERILLLDLVRFGPETH